MKIKVLSLLASIALLSFASCTDEVQELANDQPQALKQIVMTTQDFQSESGSRTLYEIGEAVKCTWAANDTVGVFPDEGAQAYFPMASGAGTKNATFDGKGWALKDGYTYGAYYPFIGAMYLDRNAVPVSYEGQTQKGNASTAHLGAYDYMVASPTISEFGSAQFTFKHLSALVQLRITVPQPATLTSVKLVTESDDFAVEGKVDIMADAPSIASTKLTNEIVLNLQDVATTEENQVITLYMMIPPVDLSEQTLKAVIASDKGNQEIAFEGKEFKAGTAYGLSGEMESDVEAENKDVVVHVDEAGTMRKLLGDNYLSITSLKVAGLINGDDVYYLRKMLGASNFSEIERGKLATLDLSETKIVEGGEWYYEASSSSQFYTSNDVIGDCMFSGCANLKDIVLPINITSIGEAAFSGCFSLTSIDLPFGVSLIGGSAFSGCSSLTSIELPSSISSIGSYAFYECSSLISVYITDLSAWCNITFESQTSNPLFYGKEFYLNNNELTELIIPADVKVIKDNAFYQGDSFMKVIIGDGVTSIGESAFCNCSSLISVTIGDGVTSISSGAFSNCSSLTDVTIGDGVISIENSAFWCCSSLVSVTMGNSVTSIGDSAFRDCFSLTFFDIPDSVTSIGKSAFTGCSSLTSIKIPNGINLISYHTFYNCSSLTSVTMGDKVDWIGDYAFFGCSSLTDLYCNATAPPTINSKPFPYYGENVILHVPIRCGTKYRSSSWASYFKTIKEME